MADALTAPATCGAFPIAENLCRVISNRPVNGEYRLMIAEADDVALAARPGQFFHLLCPQSGSDRPFLRRPMSVYRIDPENRRIGFLYKVTGAGTRGLSTLAPGSLLNALGPLGTGFTVPDGTRHALMVGRGVGLATLAPLARMATDQGAKVTAFLSARSRALLMSRDALEEAGAAVIEVTDEDGSSDPARLRAAIAALHAETPFDYAATCGSNRLFLLIKRLCAEWDIAGQTALEARMGCGTGMCFACVVPTVDEAGTETYRRVCIEGPVLPVKEVVGW